jgi:pectinesterase
MRHRKLAALAHLAIIAAVLCGCGGGAAGTPPDSGALAGTFTSSATPTATDTPAAPAEESVTYTLATDGSGDFRTLKDAFAVVPDNNTKRVIIKVKPGIYEGQAILTRYKHKVTIQGENALTTVFAFNANVFERPAGTDSYYTGHGVVIESNDFKADKVTFQNTAGDRGQAIALRLNGDRAVITNTRMIGWQDTLFDNSGRHYFKNCYVEGRVDFIYGGAQSVFENCEIKSKNGGYITAGSQPQGQPYGYVFINCRLTSDPRPWVDPTGILPTQVVPTPAKAMLGRPWYPYATVAYINTYMGDHIDPKGWDNWGDVSKQATARYAEYNSTGPGANPGQRVSWAKALTAEEAADYTVAKILGGTDNWVPQ